MRIIKILLILSATSLFIMNFFINSITIAEIWKKFHINSLIGFQKFIEQSNIQSHTEYEIWYNIFTPILSQPVLLILAILILFTAILFKK